MRAARMDTSGVSSRPSVQASACCVGYDAAEAALSRAPGSGICVAFGLPMLPLTGEFGDMYRMQAQHMRYIRFPLLQAPLRCMLCQFWLLRWCPLDVIT